VWVKSPRVFGSDCQEAWVSLRHMGAVRHAFPSSRGDYGREVSTSPQRMPTGSQNASSIKTSIFRLEDVCSFHRIRGTDQPAYKVFHKIKSIVEKRHLCLTKT